MPTTRAASAPSRRAIRKEEIKRQVPVANQLQVTRSSLVPSNYTVKAFCGCLALFRRLQYRLLFCSEIPPRLFPTGNPPTRAGRIARDLLPAPTPPLFLSALARAHG